MRLDEQQCRLRFGAARVARLATATPDGRPHVVPIVFALDGDTVYTAIDWKPKTTRRLRRLANIAANPHVAVLADHYADEWAQLWWARADGAARIADGAEAERAVVLLTGRYEQYLAAPPPGPVIAVDVRKWTGWSSSEVVRP